MTAITFDTLEFTESLKSPGFNESQAKGMAVAIQKVQQANLEALATKADITGVKRDLQELATKRDLAEQELRLTLRFGGMLAVAVAVIVMLGKVF